MALTTTIKSIQDIMRKDVGVDGDAQRIGQLVWLLFLKIWDDREQELELMEDDFASPLVDVTWRENGEVKTAEDLRWSAWAADPEGITGDDAPRLREQHPLPGAQRMEVGPESRATTPRPGRQALRRRRVLVRSVFEDAYQYMKSGTLLRQVINKMQADIDFNDATNRHLFGDLYEQILKDLQSAGNAGEYYTPRAVTQFAVDMVNPRLGETILDPACGTGGFLSGAIEHIRKQDVKTPEQETAAPSQHPRRREEAAAASALRHQHDRPRHRRADRHRPRQHPVPTAPRHHHARPGGRGAHQPALRGHGRGRHREQLPGRLPHAGDRRPVPRAHHRAAQAPAAGRRWSCPMARSSARASRPGSRSGC